MQHILQCTTAAWLRSGPQSRPQQLPPAARLGSAHKHRSAAGPEHQPAQPSVAAPVGQCQEENAHLGNIVIKPDSKTRVSWECNQCPDGHPHMWEARVSARSSGASCPFCTNKRVCQHNSLATKHPDVAVEFSPRNQGTAHECTAGSAADVFWQCAHGHEWTASINSRTNQKPGCPECFASRNSSGQSRSTLS